TGSADVTGAGFAAVSGIVLAPSQAANSGGTEAVGSGAAVGEAGSARTGSGAAGVGAGGIGTGVASPCTLGGRATGFGRGISVAACEPDGLCSGANGFSIGEERISFSLAAASSGVIPSGAWS